MGQILSRHVNSFIEQTIAHPDLEPLRSVNSRKAFGLFDLRCATFDGVVLLPQLHFLHFAFRNN